MLKWRWGTYCRNIKRKNFEVGCRHGYKRRVGRADNEPVMKIVKYGYVVERSVTNCKDFAEEGNITSNETKYCI